MTKVAFVTYREQPRMTHDDSTMYRPLAEYGIKLMAAAWDDLTVTWTDFDAVILRSPWDYHLRRDEFLAWMRSVEAGGTPIWNPPSVVRWNSEKSYLKTYAEKGIPVVPTCWLPQGSPVDLATLLGENAWDQVVIKPTIGASAYKIWRVNAKHAAAQQSKVDKLLETNHVMVQPFMQEIATEGEWAMTFFREWNGDPFFSHAVLQFPAKRDIRVQFEYGGTFALKQPPESILQGAYRVLDAVEDEWLYARVDGLVVDDEFMLMELELVEPFLFLAEDPRAPFRFAAAIHSVLG